MPVMRTEAIAAVLKAKTHPDLAALYNPNMECQVNVGQDGGQRITSEYKGRLWNGWTDGIQTWKPFRIPYNANTEPSYAEKAIGFDLAAHAEGIGMTGWDWKNQVSLWVAYDFDAITGHADKHTKKLTDVQLSELEKSLQEIPWVTLRRSTGGKGLHLYVFIDSVPTKNHTEHAALARAILGKLSALTKTNLETKVDICGQNMWVWHRKMNKENGGLDLLKSGCKLVDIPIAWRDHIKVITGNRRKTLPSFVKEGDKSQSQFDDLVSQLNRVQLDDMHKKLILWLEERATGSWWDADHHMLVTHTYWLLKAHEELGLRGVFKTNSAGTDAPTDINSYMFPLRRGGWSVRRYSLGVQEHESWEQDNRGWTRCYYNTDPTLDSISKGFGGLEDKNGSFIFKEASVASDVIEGMGGTIPQLPNQLLNLKSTLTEHKDGRIVFEIEGDETGISAVDMKGWLHKNKKWIKIFTVSSQQQIETDATTLDDQVRHLATSNGADAGWALKGEDSDWRREPLSHIQMVLHSMGLPPPEIKSVVGNSVLRAWKLVNLPFQPEYPGNRVWNELGAQLKYVPSQKEELDFPHWKMILDHLGKGLDASISVNPWAKNNGITTGSDYLKLWIASLFKFPLEPLPYLFFYGEQNTGKSIFHEALTLLFTRGCVNASAALTSSGSFNAELANAVLCFVEEIDLRKDRNAANRIKDWVTARELLVHPKGQTPYQIVNATHWVQMSNFSSYCPVLPGDTRITSIYVEMFDDIGAMIPKPRMMDFLVKEAPDFLAEVLRIEIPPSNDRLNVPVIETPEKLQLQMFNRTPVEQFFADKVFHVDGEWIPYGELYEQFVAYLDPSDSGQWTKVKFGKELPPQFPKGRSRQSGQHIVGNVSFVLPEKDAIKKPKLKAKPPDDKGYIFLEAEHDKP